MPLSALLEVAQILLAAGLTILTAQLLGLTIVDKAAPHLRLQWGTERHLFGFGIGAALLSTLVFLLCAARLAYPGTFLVVSALAATAYLVWARRPEPRILPDSDFSLSRVWKVVLVVVGLAYGVLYFIYSLAPEISPDGVSYRLGLVRQYYSDHGFTALTTNLYAFLSQGAEMLYLFAYSFGRHSGAKLVHLACLAGTLAAMVTFARRFGMARAGVVAAVLYLCAPLVGMVATSSYNDCALAFFSFLTFYALFLWWREPSMGRLILAAGLAGFCFAVKYTGFVAVPAALTLVGWGTWRTTRSRTRALRAMTLVGATAALFVVPWLLKNLVIVGNPFAPFFNEWFPNPYVTAAWEQDYTRHMRHFAGFAEDGRWQDYLTLPLELTIWGGKLHGLMGPAFLLFPIALLGWYSRIGRAATIAAFVFALPWLANVGGRFLIPSLPFVSLAIAAGLQRLPGRVATLAGMAVITAHAFLSWPSVISQWHPSWAWRLEFPAPLRAALRVTPEEEYLTQQIDTFRVAQRIEEVVGSGSAVLSLEQLPEAYIDTKILVCYQAALNERLFFSLMSPLYRELWPTRSLIVRLPVGPIEGFRIVQTSRHESTLWSVSEVRFRQGDRLLPRSSEWKTRADPTPWRSSFAFDGDHLSQWQSGEALYPGMQVEVEFDAPLAATEAEVIYPFGLDSVQMEFYAKDPANGWTAVEGRPVKRRLNASVSDMKRWAGDELKRNGIDFLLIDVAGSGYNFIAPEIAKDPEVWGLQEVFREGTRRLYRVS